jgi:hypothetical protein
MSASSIDQSVKRWKNANPPSNGMPPPASRFQEAPSTERGDQAERGALLGVRHPRFERREGLRSVLVVGATSMVLQVRRGGRASPWLVELLKRKSPKLAAVALANKMARIAWKLMATGGTYTAESAPAALAGAV